MYEAHVDNIAYLVLNNLNDNHLCVLGDFNLSKINWCTSVSNSILTPNNVTANHELYFIDNILSLNLFQINNFVNSLNRILDLIFVSDNINYKINECLNPITPKDKHHLPLVVKLDFYCFATIPSDSRLSFNYSLCDFANFNDLLLNINWDNLTELDTSSSFSAFTSILSKLCLDNIPLRKKKPYKLPWYSKTLKKLKNIKNNYFKKFKSTKNHLYFVKYKQTLKDFNDLNKSLYNSYINNIELNIKANPKIFWKYIKSRRGSASVPTGMFFNNNQARSPSEAANLFAEFFKSNFVDEELDPPSDFSSDLVYALNFGGLCLSPEDISKALIKLKSSSQTDADGLSAVLIKNCPALVYPLKIIFNKSLSSGCFIDAWKLSFITPFFKSGNKNDVRNYRPISKLSTISKIFEHAVYAKLSFAVKSLICPNQHGFIANRSTVSNLAVFSEYCIDSFSAGFQVDCIYTDFSKAFDKVSHRILVKKLACFGFHSAFLQWINSYLSNRRCVVTIDGSSSTPFAATSGVPQGSILGPLLFVLFINDIKSCFSFAKFLLYADDLKIFSAIKTQEDATKLQTDMNRLYLWCQNSRLSLNLSKCFQISYSKTSNILCTKYSISTCVLQCVSEFKDLGVIFDNKFSFNNHINYITSKSFSMLGFVRRNATKFTDPYTIKLLYTSFVRSHLEYAVFIWRPCSQQAINRIERVQKIFLKYALRSLNFIDPMPSYSARLMLISLKSLEIRRSILCLSFTHNIITGVIDCPYLLERIRFNVPQRSLRNFYPFYGANFKTKYASNAPITRALRELNSVHNDNDVVLDFSLSRVAFLNLVNSIL